MTKIRTAVIGTGHLGKFHARVLSVLPQCEFVCVVDTDEDRGKEVAARYSVPWLDSYESIVNDVDAVTIATPTVTHSAIARYFIERGKHVLVEKPVTDTVADAEALVALANEKGVKLQVGHIERFNRSFVALQERVQEPFLIKTFRYSPFTGRSVDIDVILDLMIHDMDLVFTLETSPVKRITVKGSPVLTDKTDIAYALLEFESGCLAELDVSRVAAERERSLRVFDGRDRSYYSADLNNRKLKKMFYRDDKLVNHPIHVEDRDQLEAEIGAFLDAILNDTTPVVTGEHGLKALRYTRLVSDMAAQGICFKEF